jgi:hypothetical protein
MNEDTFALLQSSDVDQTLVDCTKDNRHGCGFPESKVSGCLRHGVDVTARVRSEQASTPMQDCIADLELRDKVPTNFNHHTTAFAT